MQGITLQYQRLPKITNMQIFPLPLIDDGVWYPVGILAQVSYLTIYPDIFPHRACRKKYSNEVELEFLETEDPTRHGGPPRALNSPRCLAVWPCLTKVRNPSSLAQRPGSFYDWKSGSSSLQKVFLSYPTSWPMTFPRIVTSTSCGEEETGRLSLALGMWIGRSQLCHFSMFASSKTFPGVCVCVNKIINILYFYIYTLHILRCVGYMLCECTCVNPYLGKVQSQCPGITGHEQDRTEQDGVGLCGT